MDPLSLIVAALVAGASSSLQEAAGDTVKNAYRALKSLLRRRLAGDSETEALLERHGRDPSAVEDELKVGLASAGIGQDQAVLEAAQAVMKAIDPEGAATGKYNIQISGGKGFAIGDHQSVVMNFDESG